MSSRGEIVPELAALLREIADRIEHKAANAGDAEALRRLARQAAGENNRFSVKVHARRGQAPHGAVGVDRRFAMARKIKAYMDEHQCSNEAAREALSGFLGVGPETLRKAWQEMAPLLEMSDETRNLLLGFMRLAARDRFKITRAKRGAE